MTSRMGLRALGILTALLLLSAAIVLGTLALVQAQDRAADIAQAVRDRTAAVVAARRDDCRASNRVLAALRAEVEASKRTDPLLYRLVPSLDTPEVHAVVDAERERQLRAFVPRDCRAYALQAVPPEDRAQYRLPG